ncbi:hypothetical protein CEXT_758071 [Caerostris extrusa]|uniref:Uncharacterized protein n=1 Tax=Caerostris extrusa TaxID=172846 RepID=A0AAV4Y3U7_CAEEX|nr:hypothetical protein CEXT_758071 [Caerostris extrusa]
MGSPSILTRIFKKIPTAPFLNDGSIRLATTISLPCSSLILKSLEYQIPILLIRTSWQEKLNKQHKSMKALKISGRI